MALEVGKGEHGVIRRKMATHMHLGEPLAAFHGKGGHAVRVGDIHGAEGPAVDLQGLSVTLGVVAGAFIIGIGLDDGSVGKSLLIKLSDPGTGNNVGTFRLAGMKLDGNLSRKTGTDPVIDLQKTFGRKIPGEVDYGLFSPSVLIGDIKVSVFTGNCDFSAHI
jgi:hypothetical protein